MLSVNVKQHLSCSISELRSSVNVEVAVPNSPYGLRGRKATLKRKYYLRSNCASCCIPNEFSVFSASQLVSPFLNRRATRDPPLFV